MNTIVKLSVASALALGYATAQAATTLPSSGSSDLILFAYDANNGESYARDTGISINSIIPPSSILGDGTNTAQTPAGGFPVALTANIDVAADANMNTFLAATHPGDDVEWSVMAGQYTGNATIGNFATIGNAVFLTATQGAASTVTSKTPGNLIHWGSGFNNDLGTLITNLNGNSSVVGTSASSAGVWTSNTIGSNINNWYSNGPSTQSLLGQAANFFAVTGNGGVGSSLQAYDFANLVLTSAGELMTQGGTTTAVPIPAAIWLFGSGLLGLAGVGRRKSSV